MALLSQNAKHLTGQPKTKDQMTTAKQTDILANDYDYDILAANIANDDNYDYSVQHEPS